MKSKEYSRLCPGCGKIISHTLKNNCDQAHKKGRVCRQCDDNRRSQRMLGDGNPFWGKKHTKETLKKIQNNRDISTFKTKQFKEKMSRVTSGANNGMFGKSFYDVWVDKYGKEEAQKRLSEYRKTKSKQTSGSGNPMYGKPSPQGSGNGWSGWYNSWYFRSLKELAYMIRVIEANDFAWRTAESSDLAIRYIDYNGRQRTYRADFLVDEKWLVEVKPIKLFNTPRNMFKKKAAIDFCKQKGYQYVIVDVKLLDETIMAFLYINGFVKFIPKYDQKMKGLLCRLGKKAS